MLNDSKIEYACTMSCIVYLVPYRRSIYLILLQDIMGVALKAPLTSYDVIYTLPMLTVKDDKGQNF